MGTEKNIFEVEKDWLGLASESTLKNLRETTGAYNVNIRIKTIMKLFHQEKKTHVL